MSQAESPQNRPLSPHLQVYKLPYNAKMSITGRGVGIGLAKAVSLMLLWFIGTVWYPPLYDFTMNILDHSVTLYALLVAAFIVFFYLGNGIRHVIWDMSVGVTVKFGVLSGWVALAISALLTFGLWMIATS